MKSLLQDKKQIVLISSVVAVLVAVLVGVYIFALNRDDASTQNNSVQSTSNATIERKTTEEPVTPVNETPIEPQSQTSAAPSQAETSTPAAAPQKSAEETRLDNMCPGVSEFISTRYSSKKDASGNPYYQTGEVLLNDLKRQSPSNYNFYQECVAAGKISSL